MTKKSYEEAQGKISEEARLPKSRRLRKAARSRSNRLESYVAIDKYMKSNNGGYRSPPLLFNSENTHGPNSIPEHVAIIMDGNGRWAKSRHLPKIAGHRAGANSVQQVVEAAREIGVKVLTLYTFSTENWKRPKNEVAALFRLLEQYLDKEEDRLNKNNIRFSVIGDIDGLPGARAFQDPECYGVDFRQYRPYVESGVKLRQQAGDTDGRQKDRAGCGCRKSGSGKDRRKAIFRISLH